MYFNVYSPPTPDERSAVMRALQNPKYRWRTPSGVASESGLTAQRAYEVLIQMTDDVMAANAQAPSGEPLFASRQHFLQQSGVFQNITGGLKNRLG